MPRNYVQAMERSFFLQGNRATIPNQNLGEITEILSPIGFQPLGIASIPLENSGFLIAVTDYYFPAICLIEANRSDKGLELKFDWLRNVEHEGQPVRLFPDVFKRAGANRCGTVNFFRDANNILISRYGDRRFFLLRRLEGKWTLSQEWSLSATGEEEGMIHSALLTPDGLYTVESLWKPIGGWEVCHYSFAYFDSERNKFQTRVSVAHLPDWRYGIGRRQGDDSLLFVTDFRTESKPGIYRGEECVVPNIYGNGICFLADGSALVSRYGLGHSSPLGVAGALTYVPSHLLG